MNYSGESLFLCKTLFTQLRQHILGLQTKTTVQNNQGGFSCHLAAGHAFYKLLAENFSGLVELSSAIPGLSALGLAARLPLYDWFHKADLTVDHAALLVTKNSQTVLHMIAKIAGGSTGIAGKISTDNIIAQAEKVNKISASLKKGSLAQKASYWFSSAVMSGIMKAHPWPSVRVNKLLQWEQWEQSEEYKYLQAGRIPDDPQKNSTVEESNFSKLSHKVNGLDQNFKFWK